MQSGSTNMQGDFAVSLLVHDESVTICSAVSGGLYWLTFRRPTGRL